MPSEKATAIVLRVVEFSETSSVVTLLTREFGRIGALAKGARKPKGPFQSALDLLALCRIVFLRKSSDGLDLLTEAKLERRFRPPPGDLASLYAGYYIAELASELTEQYDPHPELFDLADQTLEELIVGGPVPALVTRFELQSLMLLGHLPTLEKCAECGRIVEPNGRLAFGLLAGGLLCESCRPKNRQVVSVSGAVVEALRRCADPHGTEWRETAMVHLWKSELRAVVSHYLKHLVGRPLRLHRYLETLE